MDEIAKEELQSFIITKQCDLSLFKAVAFKTRSHPTQGIAKFPLVIHKPVEKVKEKKVQIGDQIEELVAIVHGTTNTKKVVREQIEQKFPSLRKSHIGFFVADCFTKEKRPPCKSVLLLL